MYSFDFEIHFRTTKLTFVAIKHRRQLSKFKCISLHTKILNRIDLKVKSLKFVNTGRHTKVQVCQALSLCLPTESARGWTENDDSHLYSLLGRAM